MYNPESRAYQTREANHVCTNSHHKLPRPPASCHSADSHRATTQRNGQALAATADRQKSTSAVPSLRDQHRSSDNPTSQYGNGGTPMMIGVLGRVDCHGHFAPINGGTPCDTPSVPCRHSSASAGRQGKTPTVPATLPRLPAALRRQRKRQSAH